MPTRKSPDSGYRATQVASVPWRSGRGVGDRSARNLVYVAGLSMTPRPTDEGGPTGVAPTIGPGEPLSTWHRRTAASHTALRLLHCLISASTAIIRTLVG